MDDLPKEVSIPPELSAATWLEHVPTSYRRLRAGIAGLIAVALGGWLAWSQIQSGTFGQAESLWILVIVAVGAWRWRHWLSLNEVRRFDSVTVVLGVKDRAWNASLFWVIGFGGATVIWITLINADQFGDHWIGGVPFLGLGIVGMLIFSFYRTERRLTPEAARLKEHFKALEDQALQASWKKIKAPFDSPKARYPLAVLALWFAYDFSQESKRDDWMVVLSFVLVSFWLAREVSKWLLWFALVCGILMAIFAGVSALPVSAAIVIGALIVASAMSK